MTTEQLAKLRRVYWESFGPSELDVFLDEEPPKTGAFLWYLKRRVAQVFVFLFYPVFIVIEIWGIFSAESHNLKEISFDISLLCHNVQNFLKMGFWLTRLPMVRSLCLDFSEFHITKHRPALTTWILEKESKSVKKLVRRCYMISYANILFWFVVPTTASFCKYMFDLIGAKELQATYIPRYSPSRYPFDTTFVLNRLFVAFLEIPVFSLAFVYFQPIDMFFATAINMAQAQFRALNSALFAMPNELEEFWNMQIPLHDTEERMSMQLFIEDHQALIRYGLKLRQTLNPLLGLVTFNCITIICNMTIVASLQLKEDAAILDLILPTTASILVVLTCLVVFYTYTSMTAILKDAEESVFDSLYASKWYEQGVAYRKNMIFIQKQSMSARKIKMFGLGDMGRSTFIDGLRMIYSYYNFMQRFK